MTVYTIILYVIILCAYKLAHFHDKVSWLVHSAHQKCAAFTMAWQLLDLINITHVTGHVCMSIYSERLTFLCLERSVAWGTATVLAACGVDWTKTTNIISHYYPISTVPVVLMEK